MFLHGIGTCAGLLQSFFVINLYWFIILLGNSDVQLWIHAGCVKTSQLSFAVTRLMSRTGRWKPSRSPSTGRRICSTMKFLPRAITILRNLSFTLRGSWLGNWLNYFCSLHLVLTTNYHYMFILVNVFGLSVIRTFTLLRLLPWSLRKLPSTWLCSNSECHLFLFVHFTHFIICTYTLICHLNSSFARTDSLFIYSGMKLSLLQRLHNLFLMTMMIWSSREDHDHESRTWAGVVPCVLSCSRVNPLLS